LINFQSHKTVSQCKSNAFSRWHAGWVRQNVSDSAHQTIDDWFMGKTDDLCPNKTLKIARNFLEKTPYRLYHKYHVEVQKN
jgi:ribosome modulation factor